MFVVPPRRGWLAAALALAAGCLGQVSDGSGGGSDGGGGGGAGADARALPDGYPDSYDMNDLMSDGAVRVGNDISVAQVQDFLAMEGSYLAGYTDPVSGDSGAQLVVERSQAHTVNPIYMLARIQTESSLVTSGSDAYLDQATGCGCP
jgi:hypothetical protein